MSDIQDLILFNTACDEFISGKYILADLKIASILNIVAGDEKIKNIISNSLENFNFSSCFATYVFNDEEVSTLTLPNDDKGVIACVYTLLYKFKNKDIKFYDFIKQYSTDDTPNSSFTNFANKIIIPFKNALNTAYSKSHILVETNDYQSNIFNKLNSTIKVFLNNTDDLKLKLNQKEEFTMLLNALYNASSKNDKKLVYTLMIGLDYFTQCNKKVRNVYLSLEECFEK